MIPGSDPIDGPSHFMTTRWSVVLSAQSGEKRESLETLCRRYWKPVYYFVRRRGLPHDDALDATQEYFATFLEKGFVKAADRERGKFRTFVLVTLQRFLARDFRRKARRRARRELIIPWGSEPPESASSGSGEEAPEEAFNKEWARSVVACALERMKKDCAQGKRKLYYDIFARYIFSAAGGEKLSYENLAREFGIGAADVTNYLHRARDVFQKMLREEIRESVLRETDIDEEMRDLKRYLAS